MSKDWVQISDLTFTRDGRVIFDKITLSIPRGKITAIMGPSGSGKTTLLQLIGAQLQPDAGTIKIGEENIHALKGKHLCAARRNMGLLFQSSALFTHLTVFENVAFPLREHTQLPESLLRNIVLMKLEAVGLRGAADLLPHQLSGGMTRRVALARTIALDPALIMYDEPFTGQDPISLAVLLRLIKRLNELLGMTSIIVSHDVAETCAIADYVYLISAGKIVKQGKPSDLQNSTVPAVKQFMQGTLDGTVPFHYPAKPYREDLFHA